MPNLPLAIYQTAQIRELERLANKQGTDNATLMQRAGKAAFDAMMRRWPGAKRIAVVVGTGNNGGDGYVLAHIAIARGMSVQIWQVGAPTKLKGEALQAMQACQSLHVTMAPLDNHADLQHADVIIDAICGIGLKGEVKAELAKAIQQINAAERPVIALDIPTGIEADTGNVLDHAVQASLTVTFLGLKIGLFTGEGVAYAGEVVAADLQFPAEFFAQVPPALERLSAQSFAHHLKARARDWHKGRSGHVLVVGGDYGYGGAAQMAGTAALRTGAGLVSIATQTAYSRALNFSRPELMCHDAKELTSLLKKASVVVIGPGLGLSAWGRDLLQKVLKTQLPLVVDADALNLLAIKPASRDNWILTPHPGEAARLLKTTVAAIQADRLNAVKTLQKKFGGTCVLKGAGTLVQAAHALPGLCNAGNPGMASAGMGDLLSGIIAGLIAQGISLEIAAKLGVQLHGRAGDLAVAYDGERGLLATDLLPHVRRLVNGREV